MNLFGEKENNRVGTMSPMVLEEEISGEHEEGRDIKPKHRDCTGLLLYNTMLPLIRSQQIFGLYFHSVCPFRQATGKVKWSVGKIYSTFILIVICFNFLRYWSTFKDGFELGPDLFGKLIFMAWYFECAANSCTMYHACSSPLGMEAFFFRWHQIHSVACNSKLAIYRKKTKIYVSTAWVAFAANSAFGFYGIFYTFSMDSALAPFSPDMDFWLYVRIAYLIMHIWLSACWSFVGVFGLFIISLMHWEFKCFNTMFRSHIKDDGSFSGDFEHWRLRHQKLSSLVSTADGAISVHIGVSFACCILIAILIVYNMIWWPKLLLDPLVAFMFAFWALVSIGSLSLLSIWAAYVHEEAHALWDDVHQISLKEDAPAHLRAEVTAFMVRLGGPPIGFTTAGLFVIDKECILTIFGLVVTYFVLVIQFSPGGSTASDGNLCNCTAF
ncbi:hypothetical protein CAPTEDRAFT_184861 [Capitella teleta]|uniref:Gustatory receptor n=1 Tax=Capitella teleta TaxID=283909 RepID=X1ZH67_CAPTE|nr:hypothetical protein CAPTEDRAFT_184861 [Capitella teleta]|eukprot:ELT90075.1 hypothetical protein CAPTEDRAFT_184861 [Capitella teleta]